MREMLGSAGAYPTVAVSDLARAREFYEGTLGCRVVAERPDGMFLMTDAGSRFLVYPSRFAGTNQATYMGWEVDDVVATVAGLRERGVVFEEYDFEFLKTEDGIAELEGLGKAAWFKDPDGNILAIGEEAEIS